MYSGSCGRIVTRNLPIPWLKVPPGRSYLLVKGTPGQRYPLVKGAPVQSYPLVKCIPWSKLTPGQRWPLVQSSFAHALRMTLPKLGANVLKSNCGRFDTDCIRQPVRAPLRHSALGEATSTFAIGGNIFPINVLSHPDSTASLCVAISFQFASAAR